MTQINLLSQSCNCLIWIFFSYIANLEQNLFCDSPEGWGWVKALFRTGFWFGMHLGRQQHAPVWVKLLFLDLGPSKSWMLTCGVLPTRLCLCLVRSLSLSLSLVFCCVRLSVCLSLCWHLLFCQTYKGNTSGPLDLKSHRGVESTPRRNLQGVQPTSLLITSFQSSVDCCLEATQWIQPGSQNPAESPYPR